MTTTNLEQSQKLKELGLPQDMTYVWVKNTYDGKYFLREKVKGHAELCAYTLDELIEYLGDSFGHLCRWEGDSGVIWFASEQLTIDGKYNSSEIKAYDSRGCSGRTPLEAVYNLVVAIKEAK